MALQVSAVEAATDPVIPRYAHVPAELGASEAFLSPVLARHWASKCGPRAMHISESSFLALRTGEGGNLFSIQIYSMGLLVIYGHNFGGLYTSLSPFTRNRSC